MKNCFFFLFFFTFCFHPASASQNKTTSKSKGCNYEINQNYLKGFDRGKPEEKLITYKENGAPNIKIFIDDKGVSPLVVDNNKDKNTIDPFSLILEIIDQINKENDCSNNFSIFDGKRRYSANV